MRNTLVRITAATVLALGATTVVAAVMAGPASASGGGTINGDSAPGQTSGTINGDGSPGQH